MSLFQENNNLEKQIDEPPKFLYLISIKHLKLGKGKENTKSHRSRTQNFNCDNEFYRLVLLVMLNMGFVVLIL